MVNDELGSQQPVGGGPELEMYWLGDGCNIIDMQRLLLPGAQRAETIGEKGKRCVEQGRTHDRMSVDHIDIQVV